MIQARYAFGVLAIAGGLVLFQALPAKKPAPPVSPKQEHRDVAVVQSLMISESETVRVLTVPDPMLPSEPMLDSRCLLYVNKELGRTTMTCLARPGVQQQ